MTHQALGKPGAFLFRFAWLRGVIKWFPREEKQLLREAKERGGEADKGGAGCGVGAKKTRGQACMKYRRFMVVSDIHGSEMDEGACAAALRFKRDFRPDVAVIAGDLWDFAAIRKGASEEERAVSMRDDFECGRDFAREFFDGVKGEKHLMLGNHDVRVYDLAGAADAARADLGARMVADVEGVAKRSGAKLWPYDARTGVLELGKLSVIHGFHTGAAACATHSRIYGNVIFGHVHSVESFQTPGLKQREARAIGCLCKLNMDYANRKTGKLRWAYGFAYGLLFANGEYQLEQARYIGKTLWANSATPKAY